MAKRNNITGGGSGIASVRDRSNPIRDSFESNADAIQSQQLIAQTPQFNIPQEPLILGTEGLGAIPGQPQIPITPTVPDQRIQLPPSQVDPVTAAITQESIQRTGLTPAELEQQAAIQAQVAAAGQVIRPGALPSSVNFPTLGQPIGVGSQAGQIFGSETVFAAPGAVFPIGIVQARQRAIDEAASRQAAKLTAFERPKAPLVKEKRFQDSLNQTFNQAFNTIQEEAKRIHGPNASAALRDQTTGVGRRLAETMQTINTIAAQGDQIADRISELEEGIASGAIIATDKVRANLRRFKQLSGEFEGGNIEGLIEFGRNLDNIDSGISLTKFFNDQGILDDIKGEISTTLGREFDGEFLFLTDKETTSFKQNAKDIAKRLKEGALADSPASQQDIQDHINAMIKTKVKKSQKAQARPKVKGAGSKRPEDINNRTRDLDALANIFFDDQGRLVEDANVTGAQLLGIFQNTKIAGKGNVLDAIEVKGGVDAEGVSQPDRIRLIIEDEANPGQRMKGVLGEFDLDLSDPDFRKKANTIINTSKSNTQVDNENLGDPTAITPTNILTLNRSQFGSTLAGRAPGSPKGTKGEDLPISFNELKQDAERQGLQLTIEDEKLFEDNIATIQKWLENPKDAESEIQKFIGSIDSDGSKLVGSKFKKGRLNKPTVVTLEFEKTDGEFETETFDLTKDETFGELDKLFKGFKLSESAIKDLIGQQQN